MKPQTLVTIVLAVALLFAIVKIVNDKSDMKGTEGNADAIIGNIMTRTSIRAFTDEPVADSQIETILRAAMAAPSALNSQPWKFVVVKNRSLLKRIADSLPNSRTATAPCAIAVCGDMEKTLDGINADFWIHDCSASAQNILLAAHALGLGAVWTGVYPNMDRVRKAQSLLNLPNSQIVLCIIPVGHPAESPAPKDKWNAGNYRVIE